ncbi:MAG: hypothetical protein RIG61_05180 [Deltaproteobacteria bacterium]
MNLLKLLSAILIMFGVVIVAGSEAQESDLSPLGFSFGISHKDAENIIDSNGKRLIDNKVDSKKIRTMLMQGVIVDLPLDLEGRDVSTGLEFYDKKLLSTSLILNAQDSFEELELENMLTRYLTDKYGEPSSSDSMLYFKTWTWQMPDVKLVLHTNQKDNMVKVEYTYKPVHQAKFEDELDKKRGTKKIDPAKEMFLDGDYSKPTGYDEKYDIR